MHVPEGYFYFRVGPTDFLQTLKQYGGQEALDQWDALGVAMRPLLRAAVSIPPLALRGDAAAGLLLAPYLVSFQFLKDAFPM
jgi:hypothetical protein